MPKRFLILVPILFLCACSLAVKSREWGRPDYPDRVLIATAAFDFKRHVVSGITAAFKERKVYIKQIAFAALKHEQEQDYAAVVLLDYRYAFSYNGDAEKFIRQSKRKRRIIHLITSGTGREKPGHAAPDAITCASKKDKAAYYSSTIVKRIERLLGAGNRGR